MQIFDNGRINVAALDDTLRRGTRDLSAVLKAAVHAGSGQIETTHFLIALAGVPQGVTCEHLTRLGISVAQWESGLLSCANRGAGGLPDLAQTHLDDKAVSALRQAQERAQQAGLPTVSETILLWSALGNLTPNVVELFQDTHIDPQAWRQELETRLTPATPLNVVTREEPSRVQVDVFNAGGRRILRLLQSEAEALGHKTADARHLLLALLTRDRGALYSALVQQEKVPSKVRNLVALDLQSRLRGQRSQCPLDAQHLRPIVLRILESAGDLAARERASRIGERHVARAFLATPSMAHTLLTDQGIDLDKLGHTLERWEEEEEQVEDASTLADINRVKERLEERLVGQNDAIQQILPYVQRMRFGFTVPTRPVGVFLFCGPSGSGKTETAKELARAVYGSEENLIFLEMGQFNAPESMNIFVGAPHGYVGYGEGKLTNGLRDHPRAVVLFDEIEKADPKVQDALLRFIDEGQLSDPSGPVRDGTQCIVVLTSNISAKQIGQLVAKLAQDPGRRTEIRKELRAEFEKHFFRVEFLNRVDEIVMFHALEEKDYIEISSRSILRNLERLRDEHGIQIDLDEAVCQLIGKHCAVLDEGARAAERLTQAVVITPVIDFVLRHQPAPPIRLKVTAQGAPGNPAIQPKGRVELAR